MASLIVRPGWWVIKLFYDLVFHDTLPPCPHSPLPSPHPPAPDDAVKRINLKFEFIYATLRSSQGNGRWAQLPLWKWAWSIVCTYDLLLLELELEPLCYTYVCHWSHWLLSPCRCIVVDFSSAVALDCSTRRGKTRDMAESSEQRAAWTTCWLLASSFLAKTLPSSGCHAPTGVSIYALAGGSKRNCGIGGTEPKSQSAGGGEMLLQQCATTKLSFCLLPVMGAHWQTHAHTHTDTDPAEMPYELLIVRRFEERQ